MIEPRGKRNCGTAANCISWLTNNFFQILKSSKCDLLTSLELTLLGPHGINGWKVQQKAHRYSITNLLQTILDRRPIAVSFLQQSADDGDGLMVQIRHHHRDEQGGQHLHHQDHQHEGGQGGFHLDHHYHCHGEGQGGPRRARRATAVGQSISRQSVAVERPSATKDGQEMARDGKRWQEMVKQGEKAR